MIPSLSFHDGHAIPQLGLGTWQSPSLGISAPIHTALDAGYRLIDTAAIYGNEEAVGSAIRSGSVPREELFITTKLWNDQHGTHKPRLALQESLRRLKMDYVDLYLIHWPVPREKQYVETWEAFIKLREHGLAKSIGVSNFHRPHLEAIIKATGVVPVLNQIELHPQLPQKELHAFNSSQRIITQSWSPLAQGDLLKDKTIQRLAEAHGKSPAQIILRWHLQNGLAVIPKSVTPARVRQNVQVFDFELSEADLAEMTKLDRGKRVGPNPDTFG